MIKYIYLTVLLTVCENKIQINITASNYENRTRVKYQGSDIKHVTDKEIQLFNITNDNLNKGVRVEMGKVPDEIFLKDPTTYGEVFKKYKWPEVRRKLSVRNVTVIEFIKQDVVLTSNVSVNNSTATVESKTDVSLPVTSSVTANWKEDGLPDDTIFFNVSIDFGYGKVLHRASWRDANTTVFNMRVKQSKGDIKIQSGQSIISRLRAEKVILLMELEMDAFLVGNIVANYAHTYGKYHLWAPTVGNIMRAGKLKNEITTKILLEIRYYTNPRLELVDKDTGKEIIIEERRKNKNNQRRKFRFMNNQTINNESQ